MKLIINKKNSAESITVDLQSSTAVNELMFILYARRSNNYEQCSFSEYQKFISVYQCVLYADRFKNKLLPDTHLSDYQLEDPCDLIWEEFPEEQCLLVPHDDIDRRFLFWNPSTNTSRANIKKESFSDDNKQHLPPNAP
ncbi:hypothetical protein [Legionella sp. PATHC038]|uniref:hypothetical protein n=1 Tax=Legionella sheltonii TaxID=2992041 RepID=UPI002ADDEFA0|nr:hypothetical protein [Legionella sp. PATHC038]